MAVEIWLSLSTPESLLWTENGDDGTPRTVTPPKCTVTQQLEEKKTDKYPELSRADTEGVHLGADSFEDRAAPPSTGVRVDFIVCSGRWLMTIK